MVTMSNFHMDREKYLVKQAFLEGIAFAEYATGDGAGTTFSEEYIENKIDELLKELRVIV